MQNVCPHGRVLKVFCTFALDLCNWSCRFKRLPLYPENPALRGWVYDLEAIAARVNRRYFNERLHCRIVWGRRPPRRRGRFRSIRFGSYVREQDLVRIHPALDDVRVPEVFVEYIVFHEMLHAAVPSKRGRWRWNHHHPAYRTLERQYPDLPAMRRLSRQLLTELSARGRN